MVTTELTSRPRHRDARPLGRASASGLCTLALTLMTLFAAVAAAIDPALAGATPPHPTLRPTVGAVISILITNARVAALPILLTTFGFQDGRRGRRLGDLLIAGVLAGNTILVGVALGRWQTRLLAYLPHLPIEWLALGTAAGVWVHARTTGGGRDHHWSLWHVAVVLGLLVIAASVEVLLTPHAPRPA